MKEEMPLEVVKEVLEDMISQVTGETTPTKGMIDSWAFILQMGKSFDWNGRAGGCLCTMNAV